MRAYATEKDHKGTAAVRMQLVRGCMHVALFREGLPRCLCARQMYSVRNMHFAHIDGSSPPVTCKLSDQHCVSSSHWQGKCSAQPHRGPCMMHLTPAAGPQPSCSQVSPSLSHGSAARISCASAPPGHLLPSPSPPAVAQSWLQPACKPARFTTPAAGTVLQLASMQAEAAIPIRD